MLGKENTPPLYQQLPQVVRLQQCRAEKVCVQSHGDLSWPQKCFCMCVQKTAGVQIHGWAASWRILGMHLIYNKSTSDLLYIKETVEIKMNIFNTQSLTLVKYVSVKHLKVYWQVVFYFLLSCMSQYQMYFVNIACNSTQTHLYLWKRFFKSFGWQIIIFFWLSDGVKLSCKFCQWFLCWAFFFVCQ